MQSIGDLLPEPDETFKLNLTNAQYALISVGQATGTILNDDGFAGVVHHFDIAPISWGEDSEVRISGDNYCS